MSIENSPFISISRKKIGKVTPDIHMRQYKCDWENIRIYYSKDLNNYFAYFSGMRLKRDISFIGTFAEVIHLIKIKFPQIGRAHV